jgi:GntR family transcriptional regulator
LDCVTIDKEGMRPSYLQLADILRDGISSGEYPPHGKLPSEATLQQTHGLARETVRKAVRVLAAEGLVTIVQGRGAYVTERPAEAG